MVTFSGDQIGCQYRAGFENEPNSLLIISKSDWKRGVLLSLEKSIAVNWPATPTTSTTTTVVNKNAVLNTLPRLSFFLIINPFLGWKTKPWPVKYI